MIATWTTSSSEIARMLPSTIVWTLTAVGQIETISRPSANNEVKTRPITASSRSRVCCLTNAMPSDARMPAKKAPTANGKPQDVGDGDARHDRVGQRVAHQRPALEHQIGGEERADAADQRADPDRLDHVVVLNGTEQLGDHGRSFGPPSSGGSRRASASP